MYICKTMPLLSLYVMRSRTRGYQRLDSAMKKEVTEAIKKKIYIHK